MMTWLKPSIISTLLGALVLALTFVYLYFQNRERFMGIWSLSWLVYAARFLFDILMIDFPDIPLLIMGNQLAALFSGVLLVWGTYSFLDRKVPKYWIYASPAVSLWILFALATGVGRYYFELPTFIFLGVVYVQAGFQLLRKKELRGIGKKITGWAFILWGIHKLDFPFVRPLAWLAPWGYLIGSVLSLVVAMGILLVYFEKTRRDLQKSIVRLESESAQRRTAEVSLADNETRLRTLVQTIPDLIWLKDPDGVYLACNAMVGRLFGAREADIVGKTDYDFVDRDLADFFREHDRKAMAAGKPSSNEEWVVFADDGHRALLDTIKTPMRDSGGKLIGVLGIARDITERRKTEDALRINEERYRSLFDNMLEGFAHCRMLFEDGRPTDFIYLDVNSAFETLTGLKNVVGRKVSDVIPGIGESDPEILEVFGRVAQTGKPEQREVYLEALKVWFSISVYSPEQEHFVAVFDVITERKQAEQTLRESEQRFRAVMENISLVGVMLDTEGRVILCNDHLLGITGWKRDEVLGRNWFDMFLPSDIRSEIEDSVFMQSIHTGAIPVHYENAIVTRQGERRLIAWSNTVFRNSSGGVTGIASIGEDITEREKMEDSLKRSENLLQAIIDNEPDCVKMVDAQGNLIMMNRAGLEMLEVDEFEKVKGRCVCPMITSEYRQAFSDLTARIFEGQSGSLIFEMVGLKGRHLWLETRAVPFRNEKNEIIASLGITRDITERRKLEELLRQSQKMESIGTLAGGVAHDFNNILTAISGYGHLTMMKLAPGDPNRTNIQQILESTDRAAHLTRDLLMFSRKQPIDRRPIDLNEGIQKLGKFLTRVIGEDIAFKTTLSGGVIPVLADAYQIDQVLMNLATNARDAMPRGGTFTITTEKTCLTESFTSAFGLGTPGNYAVITVSDTGQGMDEATRLRVFEPFFTTKEVGKGTGLGLSVVYGIVQQHDGQVTVYSEPGRGTTFRIYLPVNETAAPGEPAAVAEETPTGGAETILLAEDDKTVREMTLLLLQDFGYTVITASDGVDAVKKFLENKDRIQLLLFDLIMPRKSGKDAYDEIRVMHPDVKIIFASGYDPDMVRQKALLEQHVPVVYKPVPMAVLLKKIRVVLDGSA